MAPRTLILIPPSEGKTEGGRGGPWAPGTMRTPELDEIRLEILAAMGEDHPAATGPTRPAIERYDGVLYRELDAATITGPAKRRLNSNVLILSGLWGLVAPKDPIPHYKLKMSASLEGPGRLSTRWRPAISRALGERSRGAILWDLLPNEHAAAIDRDALSPRRLVTVRFLDRQGRTVSHWNKLLKGSIVRWLAETGDPDPRALADFDHPQGYRLDEGASTFERHRADLILREIP